MNRILFIFIFSLIAFTGFTQESKHLTRILFIVDASNSMNGFWDNEPKINVARRLMADVLDSLDQIDDLHMGLRVFGNEKNYLAGQDCSDMQLMVPVGPRKAGLIKKAMYDRVKPRGTTIIAGSLEEAASDFKRCPYNECKNIIILLTDGEEECNGDPCAVSRALQSKNIFLKPFIIGIGLGKEFAASFSCVGSYYDATNQERFKEVMGIVISQALNNTSAQVNLLDQSDKPLETNVNMSFYDQHSGALLHNYVHTMNTRGVPDTLSLDPVYTYRVVAQTIPPKTADSVVIEPGIHNIIPIKTPQGELEFKMSGVNPKSDEIPVIVRHADEMKTLHVQRFGDKTKYITGKYDLEILTLPRTYVSDVEISQSHTTTIEIPQPGLASFSATSKGFGSVYQYKGDELIKVCNLSENKEKEILELQPGNYVAVFKPKQARETIFTVERKFKVTSGASVVVKFN